MSPRIETTRAAFPVAPHLMDPSETVGVWFTEPPGAVIQLVRPAYGTVELARWLHRFARTDLLAPFPEGASLIVVLDLGLMIGRDPIARPLLFSAARSVRSRADHPVFIPPEDASSTYLASVRASISLLRVFGVRVVIESLPSALRSLQAAPRDADRPSPSRWHREERALES